MLQLCDEPANKQCRLCRTKRVIALEFKMQHDMHPPDELPMTGTLVLHDVMQDQWTADDDMGYVFDTKSGSVYWHKQLVDIVRICDNCLEELHRATASECRFAEFHHLEATLRKELIKDLKVKEQARAKLINVLSIEREHRRANEIAVRALDAHRHGSRLERDERERIKREREREETLVKQRQAHSDLVSGALSVDTKWRKQTYVTDVKYLNVLNDMVNLNLHPGFGESNPVSTIREHPHSWQLQHYDTTSNAIVTGQGTDIIPNADRILGKGTSISSPSLRDGSSRNGGSRNGGSRNGGSRNDGRSGSMILPAISLDSPSKAGAVAISSTSGKSLTSQSTPQELYALLKPNGRPLPLTDASAAKVCKIVDSFNHWGSEYCLHHLHVLWLYIVLWIVHLYTRCAV